MLFVGRTVRDKGADTLVDAVAMLPRGDIDTCVIGSHGFDADSTLTAYERRIRSRAKTACSSIRFTPFVNRNQLPELLHAADVLVVPSRWNEPSTLTVGEGLASGLAVVASRVGGIPEVLGDAGLLISPDNPAELAEVLEKLADDLPFRHELREKAIARSRDHDWEWAWREFANVLVGSEAVR
ncbi:hypothetical protein GCM10027267_21480 [Paramicrobacterium agarici]|nr:glycosyltransferase family 4 protein [Microbacterium agarici]